MYKNVFSTSSAPSATTTRFPFCPYFLIDEDKKNKQFSLRSRLLFTEGFVTLSQTEI